MTSQGKKHTFIIQQRDNKMRKSLKSFLRPHPPATLFDFLLIIYGERKLTREIDIFSSVYDRRVTLFVEKNGKQ